MFDALVLELARDVPAQVAGVAAVIWAFARENPVFTALLVGALVAGGGSSARRRRTS